LPGGGTLLRAITKLSQRRACPDLFVVAVAIPPLVPGVAITLATPSG
jgi:hypothetical protein